MPTSQHKNQTYANPERHVPQKNGTQYRELTHELSGGYRRPRLAARARGAAGLVGVELRGMTGTLGESPRPRC